MRTLQGGQTRDQQPAGWPRVPMSDGAEVPGVHRAPTPLLGPWALCPAPTCCTPTLTPCMHCAPLAQQRSPTCTGHYSTGPSLGCLMPTRTPPSQPCPAPHPHHPGLDSLRSVDPSPHSLTHPTGTVTRARPCWWNSGIRSVLPRGLLKSCLTWGTTFKAPGH